MDLNRQRILAARECLNRAHRLLAGVNLAGLSYPRHFGDRDVVKDHKKIVSSITTSYGDLNNLIFGTRIETPLKHSFGVGEAQIDDMGIRG